MHFPIRYLSKAPNIDFVKWRHLGFAVTIIGVLATAYFYATRGLDYGIDFAGGVVMELRTDTTADLGKMRDLLAKSSMPDATFQNIDSDTQVLLRIRPQGDQSQAHVAAEVKRILDEGYGATVTYERVDYVGPQVGEELVLSSVLALGLCMIAIMIYLWVRFEWQFGVGGILAMVHDLILTVGFYAFTGMEFNLTSVAALLTVIGYSINDSVVIYDRLRENMRKYKTMPIGELINRSVNETLARTILTGGTVLLALTALIGYGGDVLLGFSAAMFFGTVVGTYSSIVISALFLLYFNPRKNSSAADTATPARA